MFKDASHTEVFDRAMKHIKYAVDLKKKLNLKVTLGNSNGFNARILQR